MQFLEHALCIFKKFLFEGQRDTEGSRLLVLAPQIPQMPGTMLEAKSGAETSPQVPHMSAGTQPPEPAPLPSRACRSRKWSETNPKYSVWDNRLDVHAGSCFKHSDPLLQAPQLPGLNTMHMYAQAHMDSDCPGILEFCPSKYTCFSWHLTFNIVIFPDDL